MSLTLSELMLYGSDFLKCFKELLVKSKGILPIEVMSYRISVDRSDHWFGSARHSVPMSQKVATEALVERSVNHFFDVSAGSERLLRSGQNDCSNRFVFFQMVQSFGHFRHETIA